MPERKIEVIMTPHPHDNPEQPYFWVIMEFSEKDATWFNTGMCGWSASPEGAFQSALIGFNEEYHDRYGKDVIVRKKVTL